MHVGTRLVGLGVTVAALTATTSPALATHTNVISAPIEKSGVKVALAPVADGFVAPVAAVSPPGQRRQLAVADQVGTIWTVDTRSGAKHLFADVTSLIGGPLGCFGIGYDERGLLSIAFDPNYRTNGKVYTYLATRNADDATAGPGSNCFLPFPNHQDVLTEWTVPNPRSADAMVDPATAREVLRIDNPQFNHSGGTVAFGPDGNLYLSIGDGGNADDQGQGHSEGGNAQDPEKLNGKILRIDPHGTNGPEGAYGIPADNPLVGGPGRDEIYAWGFRNPFRMSFNDGKLIVADVGQNDIEEVDVVRKGGNYGWPVKEGSFLFEQDNADGVDADEDGNIDGRATTDSPGEPAGLIDPIYQYDHDEGIAILGGYVYGRHNIRGLHGRYVFGDYSRSFPVPGGPPADGRLFVGSAGGVVRELRIAGQATLGLGLLGLGRDGRGDIYVLGNDTGNITGTTGVVLRIARP